MPANLTDLLDRFAGLRVTVIGDAMLDSYLEGSTDRICREAPVPVVTLQRRTDAPGGAANTAANITSLGAQVNLIAAIGADAEGDRLRAVLSGRGVSPKHLLVLPERATLAKIRLSAASQLLVRFDQGCTTLLDQASEDVLIARLRDCFPHSDALIISDYGYGVLTPRIINALAELQQQTPRIIVADSKQLSALSSIGLSAIKPNYAEAVALIGPWRLSSYPSRTEAISAHGEELRAQLGAQIAAITMDAEGALIFEAGQPPYRTYARPATHVRAAGAGDTFVSTLALGLAAGATVPAAAELASAAAAAVVERDGTTSCTVDELRLRLGTDAKVMSDLDSLAGRARQYHLCGQRIVFTNGCFDILHRGHIALLERAKQLGDILIVGVNSDRSIRRIKGPGRPINSLDDRLQVLGALSCVDHLIAFDDDLPTALIQAIRPHLFIKGGDYNRDDLPEARLVEQLGGQIVILPHLDNRSTSAVIERIRVLNA